MDLCVTKLNPAPPGFIVSSIRTADNVVLRVARWRCAGPCAGTVAVLPGRAEFIEKYFEVAAQLLERRFDVVVLDWRGQGGSERLTSHPGKGHVSDFALYQRDLDALRGEVLEGHCRPPFFALGHSMAGAILLDEASAGGSMFERIVLTAPMIDLPRSRSSKIAHRCVPALVALGFGRAFAPGYGGATPYLARPFAGNVLTSDPLRFARVASAAASAPDFAVGAPTIGWANAAFRQMRRLSGAAFPRDVRTPVLMVVAGVDAVVDSAAAEALAGRLEAGACIRLEGSRHEILIEQDHIREQFWAAFDAFVPGPPIGVGSMAALAPP